MKKVVTHYYVTHYYYTTTTNGGTRFLKSWYTACGDHLVLESALDCTNQCCLVTCEACRRAKDFPSCACNKDFVD
jgi:hypothetical protein